MTDTESKGRDVDLKYVFGILILWAGVGIIGLIFRILLVNCRHTIYIPITNQ